MKAWFYLCAVCVVSLALGGCTGSDKSKDSQPNDYDIKGTVTAIDASKPAVTLDHEDIPGLMKAMEMEFPVASPKVLEGLKKGDKVRGRLGKSGSGYTITHLEKR
jgi:protein SCO1/2